MPVGLGTTRTLQIIGETGSRLYSYGVEKCMRIQIAATEKDWIDFFSRVDNSSTFDFYKRGRHSDSNILSFKYENLECIGVSKTGIYVGDDSYLIDIDSSFKIRQIEGISEQVYVVDGVMNKDAITFYPGGVFGEEYFVIGELSSQSTLGGKVLREWSKIIRKWRREGAIYFGEDCAARMKDKFFTFDYRHEKWDLLLHDGE